MNWFPLGFILAATMMVTASMWGMSLIPAWVAFALTALPVLVALLWKMVWAPLSDEKAQGG